MHSYRNEDTSRSPIHAMRQCQMNEALLDASRQRARRVLADAQLKEKEAGEMERAFGKDDLIKARKEVEDTRARLSGERV